MNRDEWMKFFNRLPAAASDYLLESSSGDSEDKARENLGYDYDAWDRVMDIAWDLIFKKTQRSILAKTEWDHRKPRIRRSRKRAASSCCLSVS